MWTLEQCEEVIEEHVGILWVELEHRSCFVLQQKLKDLSLKGAAATLDAAFVSVSDLLRRRQRYVIKGNLHPVPTALQKAADWIQFRIVLLLLHHDGGGGGSSSAPSASNRSPARVTDGSVEFDTAASLVVAIADNLGDIAKCWSYVVGAHCQAAVEAVGGLRHPRTATTDALLRSWAIREFGYLAVLQAREQQVAEAAAAAAAAAATTTRTSSPSSALCTSLPSAASERSTPSPSSCTASCSTIDDVHHPIDSSEALPTRRFVRSASEPRAISPPPLLLDAVASGTSAAGSGSGSALGSVPSPYADAAASSLPTSPRARSEGSIAAGSRDMDSSYSSDEVVVEPLPASLSLESVEATESDSPLPVFRKRQRKRSHIYRNVVEYNLATNSLPREFGASAGATSVPSTSASASALPPLLPQSNEPSPPAQPTASVSSSSFSVFAALSSALERSAALVSSLKSSKASVPTLAVPGAAPPTASRHALDEPPAAPRHTRTALFSSLSSTTSTTVALSSPSVPTLPNSARATSSGSGSTHPPPRLPLLFTSRTQDTSSSSSTSSTPSSGPSSTSSSCFSSPSCSSPVSAAVGREGALVPKLQFEPPPPQDTASHTVPRSALFESNTSIDDSPNSFLSLSSNTSMADSGDSFVMTTHHPTKSLFKNVLHASTILPISPKRHAKQAQFTQIFRLDQKLIGCTYPLCTTSPSKQASKQASKH